MANVAVYNMEGKEVGSLELNDAVFGVEVNEHLVHMAVLQQLANNRQGTQKAKTRSEVRGGGRKPWRQKGTVDDEHEDDDGIDAARSGCRNEDSGDGTRGIQVADRSAGVACVGQIRAGLHRPGQRGSR